MYRYTTQPQVRMSFWEQCEGISRAEELKRKRESLDRDFRADIRILFVDHVDRLYLDGLISAGIADRATLDGRIA